ncbi:sigma-70 family RNA polymerase sigma factor [Streptomyces sp. 6N223]|uniref:sigma-70 family RNA polymerase sigma factor n=1 Tax=Streptomyces sp. 6N223 TaxID=3457412 RepID=UPI003FD0004C
MSENEHRSAEFLAERFEAHRGHLRAVAYRILGSHAEADDAVQEAWLRLSRSDTSGVANLGGWLTTVVGRVCLDMLRSRRSRAEEPLDAGAPAAETSGVGGAGGASGDPEQLALLADSVGLALLVVLDTLTPAERLAFVLHDLFAVPYEEIASIVGRTPATARQLASRARRRVQGAQPPEGSRRRQREVVDAFLAAARDGDFAALVAVLDPDVVALAGGGVTTGAAAVAAGAMGFARQGGGGLPALIGGAVGLAVLGEGEGVERVLTFAFVRDRIAVIDVVVDPEHLARLDVTLVDT